MQVTRALEYANRAMSLLASFHGQEPVVVARIAESIAAPPNFLHQVLNNLARAGLVVCRRGAKRGYELARPPAEITLLDIYQVIEGPLGLTSCTVEGNWCPREQGCALSSVWHDIQDGIEKRLQETTLEHVRMPFSSEGGCPVRAE
ncbi:MAG: RrF2 family transcriptional regulator [Planctomycetota bacterium]|jgi:Rrf2 family protein